MIRASITKELIVINISLQLFLPMVIFMDKLETLYFALGLYQCWEKGLLILISIIYLIIVMFTVFYYIFMDINDAL